MVPQIRDSGKRNWFKSEHQPGHEYLILSLRRPNLSVSYSSSWRHNSRSHGHSFVPFIGRRWPNAVQRFTVHRFVLQRRVVVYSTHILRAARLSPPKLRTFPVSALPVSPNPERATSPRCARFSHHAMPGAGKVTLGGDDGHEHEALEKGSCAKPSQASGSSNYTFK